MKLTHEQAVHCANVFSNGKPIPNVWLQPKNTMLGSKLNSSLRKP